MIYKEVNLDGLVGPTHFYGGLSFGNKASMQHKNEISKPRLAALEGLNKMATVFRMGITQGFLPPHERPNISLLRNLGFYGDDKQVINKVAKVAPKLLQAAYSSSFMWAANAAWVATSLDTEDNKVHFTPANLVANLHRSQEALQTSKILKKIFYSPDHFIHHLPLTANGYFSDEGSANYIRLQQSDSSGISLFVYGKSCSNSVNSNKFPARQSKAAAEAIARLHGLQPSKVIYAQQNPAAINAGVFHNDVIATAYANVFLYHEASYVKQSEIIERLKNIDKANELCLIEVPEAEFTLKEAVATYFFNSQILAPNTNNDLTLLLPIEVRNNANTYNYVQNIVSANNPINALEFVDLNQSMANGGGPACLRLKMLLNDKECSNMLQSILIDENKINILAKWIEKHYRESLTIEDLADPSLLDENQTALDELTKLIDLGNIYSFQSDLYRESNKTQYHARFL